MNVEARVHDARETGEIAKFLDDVIVVVVVRLAYELRASGLVHMCHTGARVVHLIRALLEIDSAAVQRALAGLGLDCERLQARLASSELAPQVPEGSRSLTARARRALDDAELHVTREGRQTVEVGDVLRAAWAQLDAASAR